MQIGYSEDTLKLDIYKQFVDIESEFKWLKYYYHQNDLDCMEDCVRNIQDSLKAILEDIDYLKGESL
jgi:hypothetical protein